MPRSYSCSYYEFYKGDKRGRLKVNHACFARIGWDSSHYCHDVSKLVKVVYMCRINEGLEGQDAAIDKYIEFMKQVLKPNSFTVKRAKWRGDKRLIFTLMCEGWDHKMILLHLTALRYPDEYPEIVLAFGKDESKTLAAQFDCFMNLHFDRYENKIPAMDTAGHGLGGHSLVCPYSYTRAKTISLTKLRTKLQKAELGTEVVRAFAG